MFPCGNLTEARKTYRAVLSEPRLVIPKATELPQATPPAQQPEDIPNLSDSVNISQTSSQSHPKPLTSLQSDHAALGDPSGSKKRPLGEDGLESTTNGHVNKKIGEVANGQPLRKRKKGGNKEKAGAV